MKSEKLIKDVVRAFNAQKSHRDTRYNKLWTNGLTIYSYDTPIVFKRTDGQLGINMSKYSKTTSSVQSALLSEYPRAVKQQGYN